MERAWWWIGDEQGLGSAAFRYDLVERASGCAGARGVVLLAWGIGRGELRLVLDGPPCAVTSTLRAVRVGTAHARRRWGATGPAGVTTRLPIPATDLAAAVTWAHSAPSEATERGPLWSPWSSHRDMLAFRAWDHFDPAPLRARVDALEVHARCGGEPLPCGWPPSGSRPEDLGLLLRVAGAVLGVLPADRRCFRLFVHLARARGWSNARCADALALTGRRIRQLARAPEPRLDLALTSLGDPRLCCVP